VAKIKRKGRKMKTSKGRVDRDVSPKKHGSAGYITAVSKKSDSMLDKGMNKFKRGGIKNANRLVKA
jgi:hypothetical protein